MAARILYFAAPVTVFEGEAEEYTFAPGFNPRPVSDPDTLEELEPAILDGRVLDVTGIWAGVAPLVVLPQATPTATLQMLDAAVARMEELGGGVIQLMDAVYEIEEPWEIYTDLTIVRGAGRSKTTVKNLGSGSAIRFAPTTAGTETTFLKGCGVRELRVTRDSLGTAGAAFEMTQCSAFRAKDIEAYNHFQNFLVAGGQLNQIVQPRGFYTVGTADTPVADSANFRVAPAIVDDNAKECFTLKVTGAELSADERRAEFLIDVQSADGVTFSGGYLHLAKKDYIRIARRRADAYIASVKFHDLYLDGSDIAREGGVSPEHLVNLPDDGLGGVQVIGCHFSECDFRNMWGEGAAFISRAVDVEACTITACDFDTCDQELLDLEDGASWGVTACQFSKGGSVSGHSVRFAGIGEITVTACRFKSAEGDTHIKMDGTMGRVAVMGNTFRGAADADIDDSSATYNHGRVLLNQSQAPTPNLYVPESVVTAHELALSILTGQVDGLDYLLDKMFQKPFDLDTEITDVIGDYDVSASALFQEVSSPSTAASADTDPIGYINDQSGNGNHLAAPTTGQRPLLGTDANGHRYAEFDGSNDLWNSIADLAPRWAAIVCAEVGSSNEDFARWLGHDSGQFLQIRRTSGTDARLRGPNASAVYYVGQAGPFADASANNPEPFTDPRVILIHAAEPLTAGTLAVAGSPNGTFTMQGRVYRVVVGSERLSKAQILRLTKALAVEYSLDTADVIVQSDVSGVTGATPITNMMALTQAQYDAIGTPDANTFYLITDAA